MVEGLGEEGGDEEWLATRPRDATRASAWRELRGGARGGAGALKPTHHTTHRPSPHQARRRARERAPGDEPRTNNCLAPPRPIDRAFQPRGTRGAPHKRPTTHGARAQGARRDGMKGDTETGMLPISWKRQVRSKT